MMADSMVEWTPISKEALLDRIAQGVARMLPGELRLWKMMKVDPVKWSRYPKNYDRNKNR